MSREQLTDLQTRILLAMSKFDFIILSRLADKLDLTTKQARVQIHKLKQLGYVSIDTPEYSNAPMKIRLANTFESPRPDFDKLLFNTKWVET